MTGPAPGFPAWHTDPSGRHQYRWWDGRAFTDQVADNGVVTTDRGPAAVAAPQPQPLQPVQSLSPTFGAGAAPVPPKTRATPLLVAIGVAAVAAGAVGFFVLRDDDDSSGTGTFESSLAGGEPAGVHDVSLRGGSALTIELDPDSDLDAVVGLVVDADDADRIEDFYDDVIGPDATSIAVAFDGSGIDDIDDQVEGGQVVFRTDVGFAGDDEQVVLVVPFDVDLQVVVAPFEEGEADEGDYEITIEAHHLGTEPDDDIDDLLDAVVDDEDISDEFRDLAEEQLERS